MISKQFLQLRRLIHSLSIWPFSACQRLRIVGLVSLSLSSSVLTPLHRLNLEQSNLSPILPGLYWLQHQKYSSHKQNPRPLPWVLLAFSYCAMLRSKASVRTSICNLGNVVLLEQWEKGIPLSDRFVYIPSCCTYYFEHLHWTNILSTTNQKLRF